jgi:hypothetical protein
MDSIYATRATGRTGLYRKGASVDIATWLHGLGMQQYEPAFRDNSIDAAVLPELTTQDLKDLGVSRVGDRRKLLAAIAVLRSSPVPERPPARFPLAVAERSTDAVTAERRQLPHTEARRIAAARPVRWRSKPDVRSSFSGGIDSNGGAEFASPFLPVHPVTGCQLDTRFPVAGLRPYV